MKKRYGMILIGIILTILLGGCAKQDKPPESMTLMVYMVGSDLEAATAAATNDMKEMEESGVNLSKVKLLVYAGGTPKWHNENMEIPTDEHTVFELTKDGFAKVTDFETASMGEPDTLTRFLEYGHENYQSETYGLILWDHGNGPVMGYGSDLLYENDALTLPEIETALSASPFGVEEKLSFVGFDACLMASAELACMLDDYAEYMIASQEVEPGFGWNYQFLKQCGKVAIPDLTQTIVDQYISYSKEYFAENPLFESEVTLAVMDLSKAAELEAAIDSLFAQAAEDVSGAFNQLAIERIETRGFGRATTGSEYDLVDIRALTDSMSESYKKETSAIQKILNKMVVYNDSNTAESCGLSIYYPYYNKQYYKASWRESYEELGLFPSYIEYLDRYGQIWMGTDLKDYFKGELVAEGGNTGTYTLQLDENQAKYYADGGYYILEKLGQEEYSVIYYSKNVTNTDGLLTATFDGNIIYYGDKFGLKYIPVMKVLDEVDGKIRYELYPILTEMITDIHTNSTDSIVCRMVLSVDTETGDVKISDFSEMDDSEISTGKKPQVDLDKWPTIRFYYSQGRYLTRDEEGGIIPYWDWPEGDWLLWNEVSLADELQFGYEPIYDNGKEYFMMFHLMDVQGNYYSSELYPITLEQAPETEKVVTEAEVIEDNSIQILDRDNVRVWLDLVKDLEQGQTTYCLKVENDNDFPIRAVFTDLTINNSIKDPNTMAYLTVDAQSTEYSFCNLISKNINFANIDRLEQLQFCVNIENTINDKTLVGDEIFKVEIPETMEPKQIFLEYMGVKEEERILSDGNLEVTLLGAGYQLNSGNKDPDGEYAELSGTMKFKNNGSEPVTLCTGELYVNDTIISPISLEEMEFYDMETNPVYVFDNYGEGLCLNPGECFYFTWKTKGSNLEAYGIHEVEQIKFITNYKQGQNVNEEKMDLIIVEKE